MGTQQRSEGAAESALEALRRAGSLAAAGSSLIPALVGRDFAFAALWLVDRPHGVLRCAAVWPDDERLDPFRRVTRRTVFAPGVGLPGRAWLSRRPAGIPELADDPNFPRGPEAATTGLASGVAVPVIVRDGVVAVVEGFRHRAAVPAPALAGRLAIAVDEVAHLLASGEVQLGEPDRSRSVAEAARAARLLAVAELGRRALAGSAPERLAAEAVELAAVALNADQAAFLEFREPGQDFVVRAGVGWAPGVIGSTVSGGYGSLAGYTLIADAPVIVDDLAAETRFTPDPVLLGHGVLSGVSVVVRSPDRPVGVMSALSGRRRRFEADDVAFVGLAANTLAAAIAHARADAAMARSDALLRAVVEGTTDAVFVKDLDGRYMMINAAGARVLGRRQEEIVGAPMDEVFPPDVVEELRSSDAEVVAAGEWRTYEEPIVTAEGEARVFLSTKGPYVGADGSPAGLIGIGHDITERKRAEDRQRLVAAAGRVLAAVGDEESAVREVAALVVPAMADWCLVELLDPSGRIVPAAATHAGDKTRLLDELRRRYPPQGGASADVAQVVRSGRPELYHNVGPTPGGASGGEAHLELLRRVGYESAAVVPLMSGGLWIGAITLAVTRRRRYSSGDLTVFEQLADRLALTLDHARVRRERAQIAHTLRRCLLPLELPAVPGLELAARFHAVAHGYELGGDFYDAFPVDGGCMLVIGDVCGRGAEAADVISRVRHTLHTAAGRDAGPDRLLRELNDALLRRPGGVPFATAALARVRTSGGGAQVTVACAGHTSPLVRRAVGAVTTVPATGGPLGISPELELQVAELQLGPADALVLFTDGVVEVGHTAGGWGPRRLREQLRAWRGAGARELAHRIETCALDARLDSVDDDLAVLVARVAP